MNIGVLTCKMVLCLNFKQKEQSKMRKGIGKTYEKVPEETCLDIVILQSAFLRLQQADGK